MTTEQQRQIMAWLKNKFPTGMPCPLCKSQHYATGALVLPSTTFPLNPAHMARHAVAEVICKNCSYVLHFKCSQVGIAFPLKQEPHTTADAIP
jgi:predicted nucleic-acid-binding Zn-ribbon protein